MEADTTTSNLASGDNGDDGDGHNYVVSEPCKITRVSGQRQGDLNLESSVSSDQSTGQSPSNSQGSGQSGFLLLEIRNDRIYSVASVNDFLAQVNAGIPLPSIPNSACLQELTQQQSPRNTAEDVPAVNFTEGPDEMPPQNSSVMGLQALEIEMDQQGQNNVTVDMPDPDELPISSVTSNSPNNDPMIHKVIKRGGGKSWCICNSKFSTKKAEIDHMKFFNSDYSEWKFMCDNCEEKLYSLSKLKVHLTNWHGIENPLEEYGVGCIPCGAMFPTRVEYLSHKKRERNRLIAVQSRRQSSKTPRQSPQKSRMATRQSPRQLCKSTRQSRMVTRQSSQKSSMVTRQSSRLSCKTSTQSELPTKPTTMLPSDEVTPLQSQNSKQVKAIPLTTDSDDEIELNRGPDYGQSYGCVLCPQAFRNLAQLRRHLSGEHRSQETCVKCGICGMVFRSCKSFHTHRHQNHQPVSDANHQTHVPGSTPYQVPQQDLNQNEERDHGSVGIHEEERQLERTESPRPQADAPSSRQISHNVEQPKENDVTVDKISNKISAGKKLRRAHEYVRGSQFKPKVAWVKHIKFFKLVRKLKRRVNGKKNLYSLSKLTAPMKKHLKTAKHGKRQHDIHKVHPPHPSRRGRCPRKLPPQQSNMTPSRQSVIMSPPHKAVQLKSPSSNQAELIDLVSDDEEEEEEGRQMCGPLPSIANSPQLDVKRRRSSRLMNAIKNNQGNSSGENSTIANRQNNGSDGIPDQAPPLAINSQVSIRTRPSADVPASSQKISINVEQLGVIKKKRRHEENGIKDGYYRCTCGRKFDCQHKLEKHIKELNVLKKFKCKKCQKWFYQLALLRIHLKKVHKIKKPLQDYAVGCTRCGIMFKTRNGLAIHRRREHKKIPQVAQRVRPMESGLPLPSTSLHPQDSHLEIQLASDDEVHLETNNEQQEAMLKIVRKTNTTTSGRASLLVRLVTRKPSIE